MTDPGMKCTRCRGPASHRMPSHNARFCDECLELFVRRQVEKANKDFGMMTPQDRIAVAISGGKDSLVLWKMLVLMGYETHGVHMSLGMGEFSQISLEASQKMAQDLDRPLTVIMLEELTGWPLQKMAWANRREFCSVCGTLKRHYLNKICREMDMTVLATGHHLDDEAGRLLGNLVRRHHEYLERQWPVLEAVEGGLVRKVKPLCRLAGSEIKSLAKAWGLKTVKGPCPRSKGATLHYYQEAMEFLESKMPGTKKNFYLGYLEQKGRPVMALKVEKYCSRCGAATHGDVCNVCRFIEKTQNRFGGEEKIEAAPEQKA